MLAEMLKIRRGLLISQCWASYKVNINSSDLPVLKYCYRIEFVTCQILHYLHSWCLFFCCFIIPCFTYLCEAWFACTCYVQANSHVVGMLH